MGNSKRICKTCQIEKPITEFYPRGGGMYFTECKDCYQKRGRSRQRRNVRQIPYHPTEQIAISKLCSLGIPAVPGRAISAYHTDVVAWGAVNIEVKYSSLKANEGRTFSFSVTPDQKKRGVTAHLLMLICDYEDRKTFHVFPPNHPVFFCNGSRKLHLGYTPDDYLRTVRHEQNGMSMTDALMREFQDRWDLIEALRLEIAEALKVAYKTEF